MQLVKEIEVPVSSIVREDVGVSAQKVIEVVEEVQEIAATVTGEMLKMSTEDQRGKASCTEEHTSEAASEDPKGLNPTHNTSDNIADLDLSSLSSSSHTSSTPSPSNLNTSFEYVPMYPSVQNRLDNRIQSHINVGHRLPEGHWGRPNFLNPIQTISPDYDIPTTSSNQQPTHPNSPQTFTHLEKHLGGELPLTPQKASEMISDEVV